MSCNWIPGKFTTSQLPDHESMYYWPGGRSHCRTRWRRLAQSWASTQEFRNANPRGTTCCYHWRWITPAQHLCKHVHSWDLSLLLFAIHICCVSVNISKAVLRTGRIPTPLSRCTYVWSVSEPRTETTQGQHSVANLDDRLCTYVYDSPAALCQWIWAFVVAWPSSHNGNGTGHAVF